MDPAIASIVVACIGTVGTLLGIAVKEFRHMSKRNAADHGAVMIKLNKVQNSVDKVGDRLNHHIEWHLQD